MPWKSATVPAAVILTVNRIHGKASVGKDQSEDLPGKAQL